jgi:hypothetical protein
MKTPAFVLVCCLLLGTVPGAAAQTDRTPLEPMRGNAVEQWGDGLASCFIDGVTGNSMCLLLSCRRGGPFEIGLMAFGGDFSLYPRLPVFITVDGGPVTRLDMTPLPRRNGEHAVIAYDPAAHGQLLAALRSGRTARVAVYDPAHLQRDNARLDLGMRPDLVDATMRRCNAPALSTAPMAASTPETDTARFVLVNPGLADPEATRLATTLLRDALAAEPGTSVMASIAVLPDGRRILVAEHGVSTFSYGITGVGTHVFTALPGGEFRLAYRTPGAVTWLDTSTLSEGFPDLWVRAYRGMSVPYGVWRHQGGVYRHQRNTF